VQHLEAVPDVPVAVGELHDVGLSRIALTSPRRR
jgi:hypothetical protein